MPKVKSKKTVQPTTLTQSSALPVVYEQLEIDEYSTASDKGPLDIQWCKDALGWETESEYLDRRVRENPGSSKEQWMVNPGKKDTFGDSYHCRNNAGEKVRCNSNAHNRPFDERWCESLIHSILHGQWAGPYTVPGETVNGETVRISRYGRVLSGQHQMTACILAGERLTRDRGLGLDHPNAPLYPAWVGHDEPFIETAVVKGMSEDPRILMTVDYVKPRTAADVFYTSAVFRGSTPPERQELCRVLATAVDTLWTRTDARGYRTHPEIVGFLERHPRLLQCVEQMFKLNNHKVGRRVSKLRLNPGQCAALAYIMGSSGPETDGDTYRNEMPPTERNLDWSRWDQQEEFWESLTGGTDFALVRTALGRLVESNTASEENQGLGGRIPEKWAILANAWERWCSWGDTRLTVFDSSDLSPNGILCLSYTDLDAEGNKLPEGQIALIDCADFGGIDCPTVSTGKVNTQPPDPPPPTGGEYERLKEEALARRKQ